VEAALLREWPGNVRQLLRTVDASIVTARLSGRTSLMAEDLPPEPSPKRAESVAASAENTSEEPSDDEIRLALKVSGGNVSVAARALGIHRSRLRRWMEKEGRAKRD
jgi:transcriptional regulator with PAS, ATPase and Fis domain